MSSKKCFSFIGEKKTSLQDCGSTGENVVLTCLNYLYTSDNVFITNNTIKYFTNLIRQRIYYTNSLWNIWSPQSIIWNERIHWGPTTPITTIGPKCHGLFVTYYSTYHHHLTSIRYIPHMEHDIPVQNTCSHSKYLNIVFMNSRR